MRPTHIPLWHGYTYDDLDHLTRRVLCLDRWRTDMDTTDRYDAVQFAITEHLLTSAEPPSRRALVDIGLRASNDYVQREMHHHGYDTRQPEAGAGGLPGFQRYWQSSGHVPFDERLVERLALNQVWSRLTLFQQQAVMALALAEDHQGAADRLGVSLMTFSGRLKKARKTVYGLWHEHETPPRRRRMDKRVLTRSTVPLDSQGKRRLAVSEVEELRVRHMDGATLRQLAAEVGYSAGALCNLMRGKRRTAPDPVGGGMP